LSFQPLALSFGLCASSLPVLLLPYAFIIVRKILRRTQKIRIDLINIALAPDELIRQINVGSF
jgi:hypothetical protein